MAVVDASVLVSALSAGEAYHQRSRQWWAAALRGGTVINAPAIILPEATTGLARALVDRTQASAFMTVALGDDRVVLWPVTVAMATRASEIVGALRIRGCDAVYVALAEQLGEPLVTLDEEQLLRGAAVVATLRPG